MIKEIATAMSLPQIIYIRSLVWLVFILLGTLALDGAPELYCAGSSLPPWFLLLIADKTRCVIPQVMDESTDFGTGPPIDPP